MKFKKLYVLLFFSIMFVATFFRLYALQTVPPSPSLDEVSIGYNAYSILHTGKDEYGNVMPVLLRAYDDWRPAFYVYTVIPSIAVFGLSVFAVRVPSVLLSLVTVGLTYFLIKELFRKYEYKHILAFVGMFLLAISPWHIYISRLGHEVNLGLTAQILAITLFLMSISNGKKRWYIIFSLIFFALSLNTYQTAKVFMPIIGAILLLCFYKNILAMKKEFFIGMIIGIVILIPILKASFSTEGLTRLQGTSAFSHLDQEYRDASIKLLADKKDGNILGQIIDNRRFVPVIIFTSNYFSHFNVHWLFGNTGNDSFKAPNMGLLYIWEMPFLLFGFLALLLVSIEKKTKILIFSWIVIAFIAPSITTQAPHAMRAFTVLPMPQLLVAFGILQLGVVIKKLRIPLFSIPAYTTVIIILSLWGVAIFGRQYFIVFPKQQSESFQYAYFTALPYVLNHKYEYKKIVISNENNLYQSYMFYLFASHYNPKKYLAFGGTKSGGFAVWHQIDTIQFRPINWNKEKHDENTLYVGNSSDFPSSTSVLKKTFFLDGKDGVSILK